MGFQGKLTMISENKPRSLRDFRMAFFQIYIPKKIL